MAVGRLVQKEQPAGGEETEGEEDALELEVVAPVGAGQSGEDDVGKA